MKSSSGRTACRRPDVKEMQASDQAISVRGDVRGRAARALKVPRITLGLDGGLGGGTAAAKALMPQPGSPAHMFRRRGGGGAGAGAGAGGSDVAPPAPETLLSDSLIGRFSRPDDNDDTNGRGTYAHEDGWTWSGQGQGQGQGPEGQVQRARVAEEVYRVRQRTKRASAQVGPVGA
jgi:hypothetical protein